MKKFVCLKNFSDGGKVYKIKDEIQIDEKKDKPLYEYYVMKAKQGYFAEMNIKTKPEPQPNN